jgi:hypothetical protein
MRSYQHLSKGRSHIVTCNTLCIWYMSPNLCYNMGSWTDAAAPLLCLLLLPCFAVLGHLSSCDALPLCSCQVQRVLLR